MNKKLQKLVYLTLAMTFTVFLSSCAHYDSYSSQRISVKTKCKKCFKCGKCQTCGKCRCGGGPKYFRVVKKQGSCGKCSGGHGHSRSKCSSQKSYSQKRYVCFPTENY